MGFTKRDWLIFGAIGAVIGVFILILVIILGSKNPADAATVWVGGVVAAGVVAVSCIVALTRIYRRQPEAVDRLKAFIGRIKDHFRKYWRRWALGAGMLCTHATVILLTLYFCGDCEPCRPNECGVYGIRCTSGPTTPPTTPPTSSSGSCEPSGWDKSATLPGVFSVGKKALAFSPDGRLLVTPGEQDALKLWDVGSCEGVEEWNVEGWTEVVAFSPDGRTVASAAGAGNTVELWDTSSSPIRHIGTLPHQGAPSDLAFSSDGKMLVTSDGTARVWDISNESIKATVKDRGLPVAFRPGGREIATVDESGRIELVDVASSAVVKTIPGFADLQTSNAVEGVAFSPDGRLLAACGFRSTARLWKLDTRKAGQVFKAQAGFVTAVAFSPDGKLFAAGSDDGTVTVWNSSTNKQLGRFLTKSQVTAIVFSPDTNAHLLAVASAEHVTLWRTPQA